LSFDITQPPLSDFLAYLTDLHMKPIDGGYSNAAIAGAADAPKPKERADDKQTAIQLSKVSSALSFRRRRMLTRSRARQYLHYGLPRDAPFADVKVFDAVCDQQRWRTFRKALVEEHGLKWSAVVKYSLALTHFLNYLRGTDLTSDQRARVERTLATLEASRKNASSAARSQLRRSGSREQREAQKTLVPIETMNKVAERLMGRTAELTQRIEREGGAAVVSMAEAAFFRMSTVFKLFHDAKITRRMIYSSLTLADWRALPRRDGCKYLQSDSFKTSKTYGMDTVIFPVDLERQIDVYIGSFRPVLASGRAADAPWSDEDRDALWLNTNGKRLVDLSQDISAAFRLVDPKLHINITSLRMSQQTAAREKLDPKAVEEVVRNSRHSSMVAQLHYEKIDSYEVAKRGMEHQQQLLGRAPAPPPPPPPPAADCGHAECTGSECQRQRPAEEPVPPPSPPPVEEPVPAPPPPPPTYEQVAPRPQPQAEPAPVEAKAAPFTQAMDAIILAHGNAGAGDGGTTKVSWVGLRKDEMGLFGAYTANQLRWRYKTLIHSARAPSRGPRKRKAAALGPQQENEGLQPKRAAVAPTSQPWETLPPELKNEFFQFLYNRMQKP